MFWSVVVSEKKYAGLNVQIIIKQKTYLKINSTLGLGSYHNRGKKGVYVLCSDHNRGQKLFKFLI